MAYFIRVLLFVLVKISNVYWMAGLSSINKLFPKPPSGIIYLYCMKLRSVKTILLFIASWDSFLSWKVCVQEPFCLFWSFMNRLGSRDDMRMNPENEQLLGGRKDEFTNRLFILISTGNSHIVKWQHTVKFN